jgi:hypothetical protein
MLLTSLIGARLSFLVQIVCSVQWRLCQGEAGKYKAMLEKESDGVYSQVGFIR